MAFYQGEGEGDVPEEDEYRELAMMPREKRTEEQTERLRFLANYIMDECNNKKLRDERDRLRGLLDQKGINWKVM